MTRVVLGVDASTTGVKAIAWDEAGRALGEGRASYELFNPAPDAWEQDAEAWWGATLEALGACVSGLGDDVQVLALCVTHQRETFVLTDPDGVPVHPALVWMDARGKRDIANSLGPLSFENAHAISGKPPCITPSFYKLSALLRRAPALRTPELRVLDVHAFLVWRLTGRFATSLASADPLGLIDMQARAWSQVLLARLELSEAQLPALVAPGEQIGTLNGALASQLGLPADLPIVAGLGDGQAAGLGAGLVLPGRAYLNLGTAIVSGVLAQEYRISRAFRTLYAGAAGSYFVETDLLGGTFTLNWLQTLLQSDAGTAAASSKLAALERAAVDLPPGAGGLLALPYFAGVMNPYWDDAASGVLLGLTAAHGPAHLYRAIIEGIALEHRVHTEGVEAALGEPITEFVVMGGGSRSDLWCQILADVLQRPIVRSATVEATCLGAGMLAAVHVRLVPDLASAAQAMTQTGRRFVPESARTRYDELFQIYRELYPSNKRTLAALARFRETSA